MRLNSTFSPAPQSLLATSADAGPSSASAEDGESSDCSMEAHPDQDATPSFSAPQMESSRDLKVQCRIAPSELLGLFHEMLGLLNVPGLPPTRPESPLLQYPYLSRPILDAKILRRAASPAESKSVLAAWTFDPVTLILAFDQSETLRRMLTLFMQKSFWKLDSRSAERMTSWMSMLEGFSRGDQCCIIDHLRIRIPSKICTLTGRATIQVKHIMMLARLMYKNYSELFIRTMHAHYSDGCTDSLRRELIRESMLMPPEAEYAKAIELVMQSLQSTLPDKSPVPLPSPASPQPPEYQ